MLFIHAIYPPIITNGRRGQLPFSEGVICDLSAYSLSGADCREFWGLNSGARSVALKKAIRVLMEKTFYNELRCCCNFIKS